MTGSDTSANALFAKLQVSAAENLQHAGIHGATPELMLAANTTGGVVGKMILPAVAGYCCYLRGHGRQGIRHPQGCPPLVLRYARGRLHPGLPADQRSVLHDSLI